MMTPRTAPRPSLVLVVSVLVLGLAACDSGREGVAAGATACERYLACLDHIAASGGEAASAYQGTIDQARTQYGAGGACDSSTAARQQCEASCTSAIAAAKQAFPSVSACSAPPTMNAGGGGDGPCKAYLSCLLASSPSSYAAALTIYGEEAACWDTPAQSASCDQACDAAIDDLSDVCSCSGTICTGYYKLSSGNYAVAITPKGSDPTCPMLGPDGLFDVDASFTNHARVTGQLKSTSQFGGVSIVSLRGDIEYLKNAGTASWDAGFGLETTVELTADDAFESDVLWYSHGCAYRLAFTKP